VLIGSFRSSSLICDFLDKSTCLFITPGSPIMQRRIGAELIVLRCFVPFVPIVPEGRLQRRENVGLSGVG